MRPFTIGLFTWLFLVSNLPAGTLGNVVRIPSAGATWVRRDIALPDPRSQFATAYDSLRGVTVLFGGLFPGVVRSDETWEWDGTTWTRRSPVSSPAARAGHAMAFDAARGRVVLFGGQSAVGVTRETWEWDGITW